MFRNPKPLARARRVQLVAESVSVCCPFCGEAQPNAQGSELWIPQDFMHKAGKSQCVSCDAPILIFSDPKAQFGVRA